MKWIGIVIIIVLIALVASSTADIINPNSGSNNGMGNDKESPIKHCYVIENENQYPRYIFGFYALPHPGGGFVSLEDQDCFTGSFYHLAMPKISVIDRTRYYQLVQNKPLDYVRDESIISSNYWAPRTEYAARAENRASRTDVLTVITLNKTHLVVKNSRAFYTDLDGHTEEIPLDNNAIKTTPATTISTVQVPSPSFTQTTGVSGQLTQTQVPMTIISVPVSGEDRSTKDGNPLAIDYYVLLPLLAACVIAAILIKRYRQ